jgi:hypothetical protein
MKTLHNINKAPFEIGRLLSLNNKICSFLLDDSADPQIDYQVSLTDLLNQHYITIYPPVEDGAIQDQIRNTYIVILLDRIDPNSSSENIFVNGSLYVTTDKAHVLLSNNRNRLLELIDEIYKTLDGIKLTSAGELHINNISHIMITNFRAGYRIDFTFSDQQGRKAEI